MSQDRQIVRTAGAEACPVFQDFRLAKTRNQIAPIAAWDQINIWGADHMFQEITRLHDQAQHLAFDGARR